MISIPDKNKLLRYFSICNNWEEKYLYIMQLGKSLPPLPSGTRTKDYLISGCQSNVWIVISATDNGYIKLYGDSDAAIVKGLIAIVFIIYTGLTLTEIISLDISVLFNKLSLNKHLTPNRSQGLYAVVRAIRTKAAAFVALQASQAQAKQISINN
ncbi:cysteine desulfuration protein SufE [Candidatus Palibaumannia cicadellinicola]|uniref:Sulfur acceptor protein SufE for iron-sulfur cluster assembly n=1 Tax=Candidatus Palibaumannia cicadellinicola TaxID=186490 RepID=A0A0K2BLC7_9GAMM|nr:cysteine desulfuration protein SufE [Candidatus Baumannia cicadellinicola]AKZ65997.1 Sulfur acceptor protein SufE for iron-sulfur cluster assembly [Candidatus Baumannia cicadellinicola]